jgi:flagellar biosynthesis protein FlhF
MDADANEATEGIVTIKTYRGRSVAEALSALKKELGSDAVILNTRTFTAGGFLGFGRKTFTEIIATDASTKVPTLGPRRGAGRKAEPAPVGRSAPQKPAEAPRQAASSNGAASGAAARAAYGAASGPRQPEGGAGPEVPGSSIREVAKLIMAASGPERGAGPSIEDEVASIKRMVGQVLRSAQGSRGPSMPDALLDCYQQLLEAEVAGEIADEVADGVRRALAEQAMNDPGLVRQAVLRRLAGYIPVTSDAGRVSRAADGRPLTIALLGPTGVGKTTTLAKLAATYKLRQGRKVGLITCDTYRIAAVDQLRTYAEIIGLPLKVAMTPGEVRSACMALSDNDVILIDTAGRSPRDAARLTELRAMLDAAAPHQRHLVMASTSSPAVLNETASAFAPLGCDRLILTKLDEAVNFGVLANVARSLKTKLSFVTMGQEVPDHIEAGNPDRLARIIMSPEVMR